MLNPILVPLDGSPLAESVLPHAVAITHAFETRTILLSVLELNRILEPFPCVDPLGWQINKTEVNVYLDGLVSALRPLGVQAQKTVLEGVVAERIVDYVQSQKVNLIILSDHGRSGVCPWGISSVTQKIVCSAPTSLMIVRVADHPKVDLAEQQYRRLLIPLDGSFRAEGVLPIAVLLARCFNTQIHLAHVIHTPEMARRTPLSPDEADLCSQVTQRNGEVAAQYLEQVASRFAADNLDVRIHLPISGENALALHNLIDKEAIDLVIMNAHGFSGNVRWPYGALVHHFIFYGRTPLLILQDFPNKAQPIRSEVVSREQQRLSWH